jgi:hypothetical protein
MRPVDLKNAIVALIKTKRPIYVWGPPGCAKSSIVKQAASESGLQLIDLRAVLLDPVDLRGLPHVNGDNMAHWCQPGFLPREGKGMLFLDELAQAPPLVQAACLQLTLDRKIGEYTLPDGWIVIAASNRAEDRAGVHKLISPLLNRFIHLDLDVSVDDWQDWAVKNDIAPEVRSFLRFRPELLLKFVAASGQRSFPTPRSWDFVSQVLPATSPDLLLPIVAGCVGEGPAAEYIAFHRVYHELPDVKDILSDPEGARVPKEAQVLWALCGAITEAARKADDKTLTAIARYASRISKEVKGGQEFSIMLIRDVLTLQPRILTLPAAASWLKEHRNLLMASN